jgi:hypothetical protein
VLGDNTRHSVKSQKNLGRDALSRKTNARFLFPYSGSPCYGVIGITICNTATRWVTSFEFSGTVVIAWVVETSSVSRVIKLMALLIKNIKVFLFLLDFFVETDEL